MTTSMPYGRPPVLASIQSRAASSSAGSLNRTQPSTPRPPARLTAAATCSDGLNPTMGCSMPSRSHSGRPHGRAHRASLVRRARRAVQVRRVARPRTGAPTRSRPCRTPCAGRHRPARCCAGPCTRRSGRARAPGARPRSAAAPGRSCTSAATRWPSSSSGTPMTSASNTSGWDFSAPSTSSGKTFSPPVFTQVLPRPSSVTVPSSSTRASPRARRSASRSPRRTCSAVLAGSL